MNSITFTSVLKKRKKREKEIQLKNMHTVAQNPSDPLESRKDSDSLSPADTHVARKTFFLCTTALLKETKSLIH